LAQRLLKFADISLAMPKSKVSWRK